MDSERESPVADSLSRPTSGTDEAAVDAAPFPPRLLNAGFILGLVMSCVLMVTCVVYLFVFMISTNSAVNITLAQAELPLAPAPQAAPQTKPDAATSNKIASVSPPVPPTASPSEGIMRTSVYSRLMIAGIVFNSCGLMIGVAMAFLGLSLFLLGVRGQMDVKGKSEKIAVQLVRVSPGALAIICSTVIVFACLHYKPQMHIGDNGANVDLIQLRNLVEQIEQLRRI